MLYSALAPTKPQLPRKHAQALGYTLIEILVVLVIISIVASMAVLTLGHHEQRELKTFTEGLVQTLTLAQEEALLKPAILGLVIKPQIFAFYEYKEQSAKTDWQPRQDQELGSHTIPSNMQISVIINDKHLPIEKNTVPAIVISSNGSLTPFTLLIGKKDRPPRYKIVGQANGAISSQALTGAQP